MKITLSQSRELYIVYSDLANVKTKVWGSVMENMLELEPHVNNLEKFVTEAAKKVGAKISNTGAFELTTKKQVDEFNKATASYFTKQIEVKLVKISMASIANIELPAATILPLKRLGLII